MTKVGARVRVRAMGRVSVEVRGRIFWANIALGMLATLICGWGESSLLG
jgi:hypothetical protein